MNNQVVSFDDSIGRSNRMVVRTDDLIRELGSIQREDQHDYGNNNDDGNGSNNDNTQLVWTLKRYRFDNDTTFNIDLKLKWNLKRYKVDNDIINCNYYDDINYYDDNNNAVCHLIQTIYHDINYYDDNNNIVCRLIHNDNNCFPTFCCIIYYEKNIYYMPCGEQRCSNITNQDIVSTMTWKIQARGLDTVGNEDDQDPRDKVKLIHYNMKAHSWEQHISLDIINNTTRHITNIITDIIVRETNRNNNNTILYSVRII